MAGPRIVVPVTTCARVSTTSWLSAPLARGCRLGAATARHYATNTSLGTSSSPAQARPHKKVTVFNDDGRVRWGDLSPAEKVARTTQQSFNFTLVAGGALLTAAVFTVLYTDVFSTDSTVTQFNRAVDRLKEDETVVSLLGPADTIRAYGERSWSKWQRNRPIASRTDTDRFGTERLHMHFHVSGDKDEGVAYVMMLRRQDEKHFHYGSLAVDVKGSRHYVENDKQDAKKTPGKFMGIRWS